MLSRLVSLTLTLIFSYFAISSSLAENKELDIEHIKTNLEHTLELNEDHCHDCPDEEHCETGSCMRLCSCSVSFFQEPINYNSNLFEQLSSKIQWYFYNNYRSPYLDPALKPPLFS